VKELSENFYKLLLEAKKKVTVDSDDAEDYTEDITEEDENTKDTMDGPTEEEPEDYTDTIDDETLEDEPSDNMSIMNDESEMNEQDIDEADKKGRLVRDFISFYNIIKNTIDKISEVDKTDIITNKITTQVIKNLTSLRRLVYDYIVLKFNTNSYVVNLYQYNCFIEALKINIKMLQKINILNNKYKTNI